MDCNDILSFCLLKEVFPGEYGALYDNDLQTLFSEFLYRLTQLLPVPDFEQVRRLFFIYYFMISSSSLIETLVQPVVNISPSLIML